MDIKNLPVIPADRADDLHHLEIAAEADLVLFMAGNQFMVMPEIISAFQDLHPEIKNIFYETLPPGLELKQILAGGALWQSKPFLVYPDVYSSVNHKAMQILTQQGHIRPEDQHLYLHNRLTLMVPRGNPAGISSVNDLARDDVRISQPDPENEDIAHHIVDMYCQAGGDALVRRIMEEKRAKDTTIFTLVHHRETPLRIANKSVDVGPVWVTEAIQARAARLAFDEIEPGGHLDQRDKINYYICRLKKALHPHNAQKFIDFILSPTAQNIYESSGFVPHQP
ncbi:MAG: substrate-binding domain-containing protein [Desulfobacterales bacterium]|jgi:ABC-type molybdate transport system substrate-binding protein